jgi:hypothetical protein
MGGGVVLAGWLFAGLVVPAGRSLPCRAHHLYCIIVAAVMCVTCNPLGTVLGVFTIAGLMRPSVKALVGVEWATNA